MHEQFGIQRDDGLWLALRYDEKLTILWVEQGNAWKWDHAIAALCAGHRLLPPQDFSWQVKAL